MADIELVIKIPEEMYQKIKETNMIIGGRRSGKRFDYILFNAVNNGIPLSKGHGRLMILLEDAVKREQHVVSFSRQKWISEVGLSNATVAIIEADKGDKE